jgi:hypothetical protein
VETHLEFRSDRFPPYEGEQELINPDLWGKRLAEFLRDGLRAEGYVVDEPIAEDWGWVLPIANKEFTLWIGCGRYQEYPDGFLCFIEPHKPFVRRFFKKIDTRDTVRALRESMDRILTEVSGVRAKRWWTHEDFSRGTTR